MLRIASLFVFSALLATAAPAQEIELRSTTPAEPRSPSECGTKAARYVAGKLAVWVTRTGTLQEDNPLRPLSRDTLLVLQVVANGRSATAFGPDFENMRQGGPPATLEAANGRPVAWEPDARGFPAQFRVVSEDGRVLLGPLTFEACEAAPAVAAEKPARAQPRAGRGERGREPENGGSRPGLPQGAIPSGGKGGLSLPQP